MILLLTKAPKYLPAWECSIWRLWGGSAAPKLSSTCQRDLSFHYVADAHLLCVSGGNEQRLQPGTSAFFSRSDASARGATRLTSLSKEGNVMADNVQTHERFTAFLQTPEDSTSCYPATKSSWKLGIRRTYRKKWKADQRSDQHNHINPNGKKYESLQFISFYFLQHKAT